MNLTIQLTPELEAMLYEQAKTTGKTAEEIVMAKLRDSMSPSAAPAANDNSETTISLEEWLREFDAWVANHESRNPRLDDSRESIYPDRW